MFRSTLILTSTLLTIATASADEKIVVSGADPANLHSRVSAAAARVCQRAIQSDVFAEYGSLDECVANTLREVLLEHRYISVAAR